jgi:hypothetical protein
MKALFKITLIPCVALISLTILLTDCNIVPISNLRTLEITYFGRDTFQVKSGSAAGTYLVQDKVISENVDAFLKKAGIDKKSIATAKLDSAIVTIPQNSNLSFDDLEEGTFTVKGLSKITGSLDGATFLFPTVTGKTARLLPTPKDTYDVRQLIANASKLSLGASLKTKRATPYSNIYVQYSFTIGYQALQ